MFDEKTKNDICFSSTRDEYFRTNNYYVHNICFNVKEEAQVMLTNPRDALRGQSRSSNIVPLHILGIVSSCATVTLSSRLAVFTIFDFKKCCDLEISVRGH